MDSLQMAYIYQERLSKDTCCSRYQEKENCVTRSEEVHDSKMLKHLVDHALENNDTVTRTLCDGSYDNNNNFRYLIKNNIQQLAIQTRRNSNVRSTNCKARNMSLTKQQQ